MFTETLDGIWIETIRSAKVYGHRKLLYSCVAVYFSKKNCIHLAKDRIIYVKGHIFYAESGPRPYTFKNCVFHGPGPYTSPPDRP